MAVFNMQLTRLLTPMPPSRRDPGPSHPEPLPEAVDSGPSCLLNVPKYPMDTSI